MMKSITLSVVATILLIPVLVDAKFSDCGDSFDCTKRCEKARFRPGDEFFQCTLLSVPSLDVEYSVGYCNAYKKDEVVSSQVTSAACAELGGKFCGSYQQSKCIYESSKNLTEQCIAMAQSKPYNSSDVVSSKDVDYFIAIEKAGECGKVCTSADNQKYVANSCS